MGELEESSAKDNVLSEEEIRKVEGSLNSFREELSFKGLLYTGLRVSTFLHVRKPWVRGDEILVPRRDECDCRKCGGEWTPKTESSVRAVLLLEKAKSVLERLFSEYERPMDLMGTRNNVNHILNRVEERADIQTHLHPHGLRGTHASLLAKAGMDAWHIRDQMGWSSTEPAKFYIRTFGGRRHEKVREAFSGL